MRTNERRTSPPVRRVANSSILPNVPPMNVGRANLAGPARLAPARKVYPALPHPRSLKDSRPMRLYLLAALALVLAASTGCRSVNMCKDCGGKHHGMLGHHGGHGGHGGH